MQHGSSFRDVSSCGNSHMSGRSATSHHMYLRQESPELTWNSVVLITGKKQTKHAKLVIKVLHSYWKWSPCVGRQQWQPDNSGFVSNTSFIGSDRVSELHNPHCDSSSLFCGRKDGIPEEDTASTSSSTHSGEGDDLPAWPSYHLFMLWRLISNVHLSRKNR